MSSLFRSSHQAYQWTDSIFSLYRLREDKQKLQLESAGQDEQEKRIAEMGTFLREQPQIIPLPALYWLAEGFLYARVWLNFSTYF